MGAIEVLASGLPVYQGAVDVTVRSARTTNGSACVGAATTDVVALARARGDKERKYHELLVGERSRLVVVGIETGGRCSREAANFISDLAGGLGPHHHCRAVPRSSLGGNVG